MSKLIRTIVLSTSVLLSSGSGAMAEEDSYGDAVGQKLASGFSNILLGLAEVPKNVIKTSNEVNLLFGFTGGVVKGTAHALGRTLSGIVDVVSAPIPTRPIPNPPYVWENWYTDTQYGPFFPIEKSPQGTETGAAASMGKKY
jgi:putative exosortase-associated protein (TIGR04073 family)